MGKFFLKKNFTSHVHIQNDQRVMGIILRYVCWGTHRPPPRGARRLTARPADPQGLGQPRGGEGSPPPLRRGVGVPPPPPLQPPKLSNTPRGHTLAGASPRAWDNPLNNTLYCHCVGLVDALDFFALVCLCVVQYIMVWVCPMLLVCHQTVHCTTKSPRRSC